MELIFEREKKCGVRQSKFSEKLLALTEPIDYVCNCLFHCQIQILLYKCEVLQLILLDGISHFMQTRQVSRSTLGSKSFERPHKQLATSSVLTVGLAIFYYYNNRVVDNSDKTQSICRCLPLRSSHLD
ncbi:Hypothetical_protein [Hexamita inflata]|uniref:Hypothetical_protein n=1 Tax=Hexamita inflata TaxID=28002 RepID=A0AA86QBU9_9EUKA|nr:Hypothetical protein HINF_LOCUS40882 [Hexamita inflata]CAI9953238.1 Hypothetical protein HINF_LOCUS40883 [Hexamita inflata]CAI9953239.1 Hypothetical protein HINF_LOCUS40884 [Hexamita inflata]CAI9953240.1 Hypothetical protein HINF_LOCUS40885 [Hexamita inflata]CAI9953242.1 Hypothetical protein HINF_LOCUS40887 [Hexamita inflata]